jgi:hypothetical protein
MQKADMYDKDHLAKNSSTIQRYANNFFSISYFQIITTFDTERLQFSRKNKLLERQVLIFELEGVVVEECRLLMRFDVI